MFFEISIEMSLLIQVCPDMDGQAAFKLHFHFLFIFVIVFILYSASHFTPNRIAKSPNQERVALKQKGKFQLPSRTETEIKVKVKDSDSRSFSKLDFLLKWKIVKF